MLIRTIEKMNAGEKMPIDKMGNLILLDLVHTWEGCAYRANVSGWSVRFKRCLTSLLLLLHAGYIVNKGGAGGNWAILPTEAGIAYAKSLSIPEREWLYKIADLNG